MARMKKEVVENQVVPEADAGIETLEVTPKFTHSAISLGYVPGEGWSMFVITYDPITKQTGEVVKKYTGEGLAYLKERFKIDSVNYKDLGGLDIFNNCGNKW